MSCHRLASRASTAEMKSEIQRRVGVKNADKYFMILGRYLSGKLSKSYFYRFCLRIIGRENLSLHNGLICTILKNAGLVEDHLNKKRRVVGALSVQLDNGYKGSCLQSLSQDGFPVSPRKGRTPTPRGRKFRDKLSPLGPLGKTPNGTSDDSPSKVLQPPGGTEILSPGSRPPFDIKYLEDGEEVEQTTWSLNQSRSPIAAPFGICINGRGSKTQLFHNPPTGTSVDSCLKLGELPDSISLKKRLEEKVKENGLNMTSDFFDCLNIGVNVFLKSIISPTLAMASSRSQNVVQHQEHYRSHPGMNTILPTQYSNKPTQSITASILDFRVAMELNPTTLGTDWPIQLERISLLAPEE